MALICLCGHVSDRKVAKAIDRGARTIDDITAACGAGACCGGCHPTILEMIDERTAEVVIRPRFAVN